MQHLELKIPPALLVLIAGGLMLTLHRLIPAHHLSAQAGLIIAVILALVGAGICVAGVMRFRRAHTTVNPMNPESSSSLVTGGIYTLTRNPMYLGFLLMVIGWGFFLANLCTLIVAVAFVIYMNRFQIQPEEQMLTRLFGDSYVTYCQRVRRWI